VYQKNLQAKEEILPIIIDAAAAVVARNNQKICKK